ncbi:hypothetical protein PU630_07755 [Microbacterium horticulturae]|uniref:Uncharacterized protein n=1 Tax=Microbacterium horticulturae TaxID=3028316 RepID=A0ABY8C5R6_9MICO|nr:hypothetical protein [Microbacterium sp. KACC 23027]WEG10426.1 hypothetical protein PU630_07755 [Microbacterium sp. KACC 23027]
MTHSGHRPGRNPFSPRPPGEQPPQAEPESERPSASVFRAQGARKRRLTDWEFDERTAALEALEARLNGDAGDTYVTRAEARLIANVSLKTTYNWEKRGLVHFVYGYVKVSEITAAKALGAAGRGGDRHSPDWPEKLEERRRQLAADIERVRRSQ